MRRPSVLIGSLLALTIVATACSSSSDGSSAPKPTSGGATTTTLTPGQAAALYQERGPYPVGVTTKTLPLGNKVEIWYPAVKGTTGTETYDVKEFTSPQVKALLTADVPATIKYDAKRDAEAAEGKFPVVLFSHGFSGMRLQSTFLTAHLASWGMIVASPDHPSRDLYHLLGGAPKQDSVGDLKAAYEVVTAESAKAGSPLEGRADTEHVAAVGHSAGGGTIVGAANSMPEIDGYVSLASGFFTAKPQADPDCQRRLGATTTTAPGATTTTAPAPVVPKQPSFFIGGANDGIAIPKCVTTPAYNAAPTPTRLWLIDKAGHNAFDDFCQVGNNAGIIGVAIASGLGAAFENEPFKSAKTLGEDGCKPPNVPVAEVQPIINHAVVSWLRNLFGVDATPLGLGPEVADAYPVKVTIAERLG